MTVHRLPRIITWLQARLDFAGGRRQPISGLRPKADSTAAWWRAGQQRDVGVSRLRRDAGDSPVELGGHNGVNFTLSYRLVLTDEETALVGRYKLESYPLTWARSPQGGRVADDTIADMIQGRSKTVSGVTTLVREENIVKDACDALPTLFDVVRTFGGDEVIEYPRGFVTPTP